MAGQSSGRVGVGPATDSRGSGMDRELSWSVIEAERLWLAALLESLDARDWDAPSLCSGWRVRDVAAHVALAPQPPSIAGMLVEGARARGRFHILNHDLAVRLANRSGVDLVAELREHAGSRRLPAVTNYRNILFDVLVHAQDIALPLGVDHAMPVEAARDGAQRVWTMGWPFWARRRLGSYQLVATDIDWTTGKGAVVEGPVAALLLLLTGRTALLARLTGPGAAQLLRTDT
jgi:uncharacterized protein (TIGR03083 family)